MHDGSTLRDSSPRYFLCDQSLRGLHGHCYAYSASLQRELLKRRRSVAVIGNRHLDARLLAEDIKPAFTFLSDERAVRPGGSPVGLTTHEIHDAHQRAITDDLIKLDREFHFLSSDRLVFNTVHHWVIGGIVGWLESLQVERRPRVALIFHFTSSPIPNCNGPFVQLYRDACLRIQTSSCQQRLTFFADTEVLVSEFRSMGLSTISLLPIPHSLPPIPEATRIAKGGFCFGFLGEARFHKGYHLLPFLARSFLISQRYKEAHFLIQSNSGDPDAEYFKRSLALLRTLSNVTVVSDALNPSAYATILANCDAVLLPYSRDYYHAQSSGIFSDAVGAGRPVVVTNGTWMSSALASFGSGTVCNSEDYVSLVDAARLLYDTMSAKQQAARTAQCRWTRFHNPSTFIDLIDQNMPIVDTAY